MVPYPWVCCSMPVGVCAGDEGWLGRVVVLTRLCLQGGSKGWAQTQAELRTSEGWGPLGTSEHWEHLRTGDLWGSLRAGDTSAAPSQSRVWFGQREMPVVIVWSSGWKCCRWQRRNLLLYWLFFSVPPHLI